MFENFFSQMRYGVGSCLDYLTILDHKLSSQRSLIQGPISISGTSIAILATYYEDRTMYMNQLQLEIEKNGFHVIRVRNSKSGLSSSKELGRRNRGFDLGIFRDVVGFLSGKVDEGQVYEIIYVNDSVEYQPGTISRLIKLFREKEDRKVYSMFASKQRGYHLQSFILYMRFSDSQIIQLGHALSNFRNWKFKRTAVHRGERALHTYLSASGLSSEPLFPIEFLYSNFPKKTKGGSPKGNRGLEVNPTYTFIDDLSAVGIQAKKF